MKNIKEIWREGPFTCRYYFTGGTMHPIYRTLPVQYTFLVPIRLKMTIHKIYN